MSPLLLIQLFSMRAGLRANSRGNGQKVPSSKASAITTRTTCKSTAGTVDLVEESCSRKTTSLPPLQNFSARPWLPADLYRYCSQTLRHALTRENGCASRVTKLQSFSLDLIDFHRREEKPMWWRMFDRADATPEELRDDSGCIEGVEASGSPCR